MRTIRNVAFLVLVVLCAAAKQQTVAAKWDCDWDGICSAEEMQVYYMCGDCGNTYCSNQCSEQWDYGYCEIQCWGYNGSSPVDYQCDGMSGAQTCDYGCSCPIVP
jgi:hypothetical protein